jgi:predicted nucleotidyltransferase
MRPETKQNSLQYVPNKGTIVPDMGTIMGKSGLLSKFFSKTRQSVLSVLYTHVDEAFYLRQLSRMANIKMGALQRELKQLTEAGIIKRAARGHQVYYQANKDCPIFDELKSIVIKTVGIGDVLRKALTPLADRISVAFIYGSFAEGKEREASDVDVLIIGDVAFTLTVQAFQEAQNVIGREINPTVYPVQEIRSKIAENKHFLKSVLNGPMIFLIGDKGELKRLAQ